MSEIFVKVRDQESLKGKEGISTSGFIQVPGEGVIKNQDTGEVLGIVLKADFNLSQFVSACNSIKYVESERASGLVNTSKTFGFQPRTPLRMRDYCCSSDMSVKQPANHSVLESGAIIAEELLKKNLPTIYEKQKKLVEDAVGENWRMKKGIFTSGIVNKNNQLRYHIDSQNMENCWSVMFVLKKGVEGGHLILPEWGVELHLPHGSVAIFNGQKWWHAVTPWNKTQFNGYRYSIVYYTMQEMCKCLTPKEEIQRAQKARTELEYRRLNKGKEV